jgi:hypothetical protein
VSLAVKKAKAEMPTRSRIDQALSGFNDEQLFEFGARLARYLGALDPEVPLYLVPDDEGTVLSGPAMASEIAAQTDLGSSFVRLFVAGSVLTERVPDWNGPRSVEEALEVLESWLRNR